MVKTGWNIEDVALALYDYMEQQPAFDDYATTLFTDECREIIKMIDEMLCKIMNFEEADKVERLMLEYAELRCKQYFIRGYQAGIAVQNIMRNDV